MLAQDIFLDSTTMSLGVLTQVSGASPFLQGAPPCPLALEKGKQSADCFSAKGLRRLGFVHKASGSCISFY